MHTEATAGVPPRGVDAATLGHAALWCTFAISGFVFIEPAPFDLAILALFAIYLVAGLQIPFDIAPMLALVAAILVGNLVGIPISAYFKDSAIHVAVTGYLAATALFVACIVRHDPERTLRTIMSGYMVAAIAAALAGIAGYLSVTDGAADLFTLYGRAKGAFKDPNVFGPFLVVPALFCLLQVFTRPARQTVLPLGGFAILGLAILLSLSRGAWGNLAVSTVVFIILLATSNPDPRFRVRLLLWSVAAGVLAACILATLLNVESLARLIAERARLVQDYDAGGHGRFDAQARALSFILASPFGIGPRDFAALWGEEAHNVYLTTFLAGGWLAGFANVALVLVTAARGLAAATRPGPVQGVAIIIAASFVGLALEGLIVDTDHWRYFWVLVGIIWGLDLAARPAGLPKQA